MMHTVRCFFFNDTATTEIYTLSLHDALPILVVCGHTHMQFDRTVDDIRIVNAGSVGMPFAAPGAYWLLLGPDVRPMRTEYDTLRLAAMVRATSYPQAEQFLNPFTEEQALGLFEPALGH